MPLDRNNLTAHELTGLKTIINSSPDPSIKGLAGIIRDETKNTLKIETKGRILTIPKKDTSFLVEFGSGQSAILNGDQLVCRSEDRVKKGLGRW